MRFGLFRGVDLGGVARIVSASDQSILPRELFLLDPEVAFLNHGSFGATPRPVFEKYQHWQRELEREPVDFFLRRSPDLLRNARRALADEVHAADDELVYVVNATTGLNIIARALKLGPGDEVLTTDHEYGAIERMWRFICRKTGATLKPQPIPLPVNTPEEFVERFWAGVTTRTRVISISHITSPTALRFPVQEICRRARASGIISVVDGAHTIGQIPLDLTALGADFYSSNTHKWLCAPKGSAFLYARREVQGLLEPLVVSWGYDALLTTSGSTFIDQQEWTGTRDISAWLAVPDALAFCREHNWDNVRTRCHELVREARAAISKLTGLPPLSPDSLDWFVQMATLPLPPCDAKRLHLQLYERFRVEVPIVEWGGRQFVRVSIQAYNSPRDVERLLDGLRQLL